ncbi:hypothetical protein V6N13_118760 [Hibiscus sabdariffa]|uniref:Uncharacterized protein n=1 Tax=Hibiscus sabdariffa TaxID=183260 RepID=A0ABR2DZM1_9ROSI
MWREELTSKPMNLFEEEAFNILEITLDNVSGDFVDQKYSHKVTGYADNEPYWLLQPCSETIVASYVKNGCLHLICFAEEPTALLVRW